MKIVYNTKGFIGDKCIMHKYYLDLNTRAAGPQVLYHAHHDADEPDEFRIADSWERIKANPTGPLEKLILDLTVDVRARLHEKIKQAAGSKQISRKYFDRLENIVSGAVYYFIHELNSAGIADAAAGRRLLDKYAQDMRYLDDGCEDMTHTLISECDEPALKKVAALLAAGAPGEKIIATINKNELAEYFSYNLQALPQNFSQVKIAKRMKQNIPERLAFRKFYDKFIAEVSAQIAQAQEKLNGAVFQNLETYQLFPGIKIAECWLESDHLPRVELNRKFCRQDLEQALRKYPDGFIASASYYYNERIVLPAGRRKNLETGAGLFPEGPEKGDITAIFKEQSPQDKMKDFLNLFENYLKEQIELTELQADSTARVCLWIIICQEGLAQALPQQPTSLMG